MNAEFCVQPADLRLLCRVALGRVSISTAHTILAGRRWSRRDATDFLAIATDRALGMVREERRAKTAGDFLYEEIARKQRALEAEHAAEGASR